MDLEQLNEENATRLERLMAGAQGMPAQIAPGTLESMRIMGLLEHIAAALDCKDVADLAYAERVSQVLDSMEEKVREAVLARGGNLEALDLSKVRSIGNRQQRRANGHDSA